MRHTNFLYLLGPLSCSKWDNNEIRYSLRSLDKAFAPEWVGIAGPEIPPFLQGITHITTDPKKEKMRNLPLQLLAACADPRVPEDLVLMNDDFIVRDTPAWVWTPTHCGSIDQYKGGNAWRRSVEATGKWLLGKGVAMPLSYEGHTPMPFRKSLALPVLQEMVAAAEILQFRTAYGNIVGVGGEKHPNAKRKDHKKWPDDTPFWSLKNMVSAESKEFLHNWLDVPSRWEV